MMAPGPYTTQPAPDTAADKVASLDYNNGRRDVTTPPAPPPPASAHCSLHEVLQCLEKAPTRAFCFFESAFTIKNLSNP